MSEEAMIDIAGLRAKLANANIDEAASWAYGNGDAILDAYETQAERIAALESERIKRGGIIHDCHEFIRSRNLWLVFCEWLHRRPTGDA